MDVEKNLRDKAGEIAQEAAQGDEEEAKGNPQGVGRFLGHGSDSAKRVAHTAMRLMRSLASRQGRHWQGSRCVMVCAIKGREGGSAARDGASRRLLRESY